MPETDAAPALSPQALARLQQRLEALSAASIRALSGDAKLHFRARRLHRGRQVLPLFAPHLHPEVSDAQTSRWRGAADGLALRLSMSDLSLHQSLQPAEAVARMLFDLLEQFRVESLVTDKLPGSKRNLRACFDDWSSAFHHARLTENAHGILLYTVAQIVRARVTGEPVLAETEDLMEATRANIVPVIGFSLAGLRRHRHDQTGYARHALVLARQVADLLESANENQNNKPLPPDADRERVRFGFMLDGEALLDTAVLGTVAAGSKAMQPDSDVSYRIFTRAYDREVAAAALVRPAQLIELREQLDRRIRAENIPLQRLARALQTLLAVPQRDGWDGGLEEGLVDGRRIAQLVSSPLERRLFRQERIAPIADTVVGLLIDCSSSMRTHVEPVAVLVDTLARALDMAGVTCEVLGHTTGAWHGGRARKDWLRAGRPMDPGRLNELSHLVFKDADTPWRRARPAMGALLKADLFRESVDGEAVAWAADRLARRPEARKLLLVLSDGCPMDGATELANHANYLDHHLREVVDGLTRNGLVQVAGLGVGLDLSAYYAQSEALDLQACSCNEALRDVLSLLKRVCSRGPGR